jgi:hypothetical protein
LGYCKKVLDFVLGKDQMNLAFMWLLQHLPISPESSGTFSLFYKYNILGDPFEISAHKFEVTHAYISLSTAEVTI